MEYVLKDTISTADIYIPLASITPDKTNTGIPNQHTDLDSVAFDILRVLELGHHSGELSNGHMADQVYERTLHYRVSSADGSNEINALLGYSSKGSNCSLWQSEKSKIMILEKNPGSDLSQNFCAEYSAMGMNRRDPHSVVQYNIAGNVLLSYDTVRQHFALKAVLFSEQDIISAPTLHSTGGRYSSMRMSKGYTFEDKSSIDGNIKFATELVSRSIKVKSFRSRNHYFENIAAIVLAKLHLAFDAVVLQKMWHQFLSGSIESVFVGGNTGAYAASVDLLISKSRIQTLPFLDFLIKPLSLFTNISNFNSLLRYLRNVFGNRCIVVENDASNFQKILICSSFTKEYSHADLQFAVVISLQKGRSRVDLTSSIYLIRNMSMSTDSPQQEVLLNRVVDVVLAVLIDAQPHYDDYA